MTHDIICIKLLINSPINGLETDIRRDQDDQNLLDEAHHDVVREYLSRCWNTMDAQPVPDHKNLATVAVIYSVREFINIRQLMYQLNMMFH